MGETLQEMFNHNNWANESLLEACAALGESQLDATTNGTYGSIRDTLRHLVAAQQRYAALLRGTQVSDPLQPGAFPGIDDLRRRADESGRALVEIASAEGGERAIRTKFDEKDYDVSASVILVQVINHATEHRSQVFTIMTQQGVQPPMLDSWTHGDATKRIVEAV